MKPFLTYLLIPFLALQVGFAQNPNRVFKSAQTQGNTLKIEVNDGTYIITPYTSQIIETTFVPNGETQNPNSHAVVLKPTRVKAEITERNQDILIKTKDLWVTVTKSPFQISYYNKDQFIISEKKGYYKSKHQPMDMVRGNIVADNTEKIEFNLNKDEVLYGGGARALSMNRRGKRLPLYNRAHYGYETHSELMNYTMPIVLSSKKYLIHFDNAPIGYLDLDSKQNNTLTYETISGRKTYQIVVGNTWYNLLDNYTNLTGKQPMLPRWALGNFASRFGYHSQQEVEQTIAKYNQQNIPVDAVILDLYWFGKDIKGTMGNLEVFRDSFPDFEGMVKRLNAKGVKTITITEPFILTTSSKWNEAVAKDILATDSLGNPAKYDFYFGNTGIIDIYKPKGKAWFWDIYKDIANKGVAGVWGDLGEPEVHPNWVQHHTASADEVHNIYGHDWAKLVFEGYAKDFPNTRPFILMRAGYSGSQRYGMVPWSGDVNRTWGGLQSQPSIALQMSMQGLGFMHSDLGGFAGDNLDDELYVRWLQYGVFQPIYRPHAQESVPSEPVFRSTKAKNLAKQAIKLRYNLLPYNYNLMFQNHKKGTPLMRPLFFEETDNPQLFNYSKTYLWGHDILVSPVLEAGKKTQDVYFPKGSNWFSVGDNELIKGGQTKNVTLKAYYIPTYIRTGAFVPIAKPMTSTENYDDSSFTLHYFYDETVLESERDYYFDDGKTKQAYQKGKYQILEFESKIKGKWLNFTFEAETGKNYKAKTKNIELIIHNVTFQPKKIKLNCKTLKEDSEVQYQYKASDNNVKLNLNWDTSKPLNIKLKR